MYQYHILVHPQLEDSTVAIYFGSCNWEMSTDHGIGNRQQLQKISAASSMMTTRNLPEALGSRRTTLTMDSGLLTRRPARRRKLSVANMSKT
jgi:hypothetical protein